MSTIRMATKYRYFFRALLAGYAVVGYGVPVACTLYHQTLNNKYNETRQYFKSSPKCFVFPFYFSRTKLENQLCNKIQSENGQFVFIYGKSFIGKSTLIRKICSDIQNGVLRLNAYSFEPFYTTLAKRLHFHFNDQYTWSNLWKNIYFPLALCTFFTYKGTPEQQFNSTLNHLSSFCTLQKTNNKKPWVLVIDDADHLSKKQFTELHKKVTPLIKRNLLTLVIVSSDPAFAAFVTSEKFKNITRLQMDEMNEYESLQFLESQPCQLFVNRMRKFYEAKELTTQQMKDAYNIAGGIPLWLIQSAVKTPDKWFKHRIETVKSVIDEQNDAELYYKVQSYMVENNKFSLGFKDFITLTGTVDNAITLLHGIQQQQKHNRLFFHDLNRNKVTLQYEFLKQIPLQHDTAVNDDDS